MTVEASYTVDVIGRIWQGQTCAASAHIAAGNVKSGDEPTFAGDLYIDDDDEKVSVEQWADTHFGDFASIDALRIVRHEKGIDATHVDADSWVVTTRRARDTYVSDFTEDEEDTYNGCMFGAYDDEEDEVDA